MTNDDDVKLPEPPECYVTSGGRDLWSLEQLQTYAARAVAEAVARERRACEAAVPDSWLDPLLTGPRAVIGENANASDIEPLLMAIRSRIRNRSNA